MEREHLRDRLAVKIVHQSNLPDSNVGRYLRDLHNFFRVGNVPLFAGRCGDGARGDLHHA